MDENFGSEVAALEPPPSSARIAKFLGDLASARPLTAQTSSIAAGIGIAGRSAQEFSEEIGAKSSVIQTGGSLEPLVRLMESYSISIAEIQRFTQWLVNWRLPDVEVPAETARFPGRSPSTDFSTAPAPEMAVAATKSAARSDEEQATETSRKNDTTSIGPDIEPTPAKAVVPVTAVPEKGVAPEKKSESPAPPATSKIEVGKALEKFNRGLWATNLAAGSFFAGLISGRLSPMTASASSLTPPLSATPQSLLSTSITAPKMSLGPYWPVAPGPAAPTNEATLSPEWPSRSQAPPLGSAPPGGTARVSEEYPSRSSLIQHRAPFDKADGSIRPRIQIEPSGQPSPSHAGDSSTSQPPTISTPPAPANQVVQLSTPDVDILRKAPPSILAEVLGISLPLLALIAADKSSSSSVARYGGRIGLHSIIGAPVPPMQPNSAALELGILGKPVPTAGVLAAPQTGPMVGPDPSETAAGPGSVGHAPLGAASIAMPISKPPFLPPLAPVGNVGLQANDNRVGVAGMARTEFYTGAPPSRYIGEEPLGKSPTSAGSPPLGPGQAPPPSRLGTFAGGNLMGHANRFEVQTAQFFRADSIISSQNPGGAPSGAAAFPAGPQMARATAPRTPVMSIQVVAQPGSHAAASLVGQTARRVAAQPGSETPIGPRPMKLRGQLTAQPVPAAMNIAAKPLSTSPTVARAFGQEFKTAFFGPSGKPVLAPLGTKLVQSTIPVAGQPSSPAPSGAGKLGQAAIAATSAALKFTLKPGYAPLGPQPVHATIPFAGQPTSSAPTAARAVAQAAMAATSAGLRLPYKPDNAPLVAHSLQPLSNLGSQPLHATLRILSRPTFSLATGASPIGSVGSVGAQAAQSTLHLAAKFVSLSQSNVNPVQLPDKLSEQTARTAPISPWHESHAERSTKPIEAPVHSQSAFLPEPAKPFINPTRAAAVEPVSKSFDAIEKIGLRPPTTGKKAAINASKPETPSPMRFDPRMGQITLVAPPVTVASKETAEAGSAVQFDLKSLAAGAGNLDASSLGNLTSALPGVQAIYPALPAGQLGPSAINLQLDTALLGSLLSKGYGGISTASASKIATAIPKASPTRSSSILSLGGAIVPKGHPSSAATGILPASSNDPVGALGLAGQTQAKRGGPLDFLGVPVKLAPSLTGKTELADQIQARTPAVAKDGGTVKPSQFSALRSKVFPGFSSIVAEPNQSAWRKAAPSYGLRDSHPTSLLAPDARIKPLAPSEPRPQREAGVQAGKAANPLVARLIAPPIPRAMAHSASLTPSHAASMGLRSHSIGAGRRQSSNHQAPTFASRPLGNSAANLSGKLTQPLGSVPVFGGQSTVVRSSHATQSQPSTPRRPTQKLIGQTRPMIRTSKSTPGSAGGSVRQQSSPTMTYAGNVAAKPPIGRMVLQKSVGGAVQPSQPGSQEQKAAAAPAPKNEGANELNSMAQEVWSMLKRRISAEADRRGRW